MLARKILLLISLVSITSATIAQKAETKAVLDQIIEHVENNSLYRENVDWPSLKKEMYAMAEEADSVPQLKSALDFMLKELKDDHGRVFYNNQYLSYYSGEKKAHRANMSSDVYNEIQSGQVYDFKAIKLEGEIGYVRIVGLPMGDNEKMSSDIQNAVCEVMENGVKSWIVDLRYNGGGNMFPMVEGLTTIIGDAIVGGTAGVTDEESSVWSIQNGHFYYDEQTVALENKCSTSETPKIAVLTSIYTASSGEALAVILKNRPKTRFFGNKTLGKVTSTNWAPIDDKTVVSISVSYYKDRDGNLYDKFVDVDEEIPFNPKGEMNTDEAIKRAVEWLNEKK